MTRYALYAAPEHAALPVQRAAFSPMTMLSAAAIRQQLVQLNMQGVRLSFRPAICFHCNRRRVQG